MLEDLDCRFEDIGGVGRDDGFERAEEMGQEAEEACFTQELRFCEAFSIDAGTFGRPVYESREYRTERLVVELVDYLYCHVVDGALDGYDLIV